MDSEPHNNEDDEMQERVPLSALIGSTSAAVRAALTHTHTNESHDRNSHTDCSLSCSFSAWYPRLYKHTIASRIIQLDDDFINYLLDDGPLVLPETENPTNRTFKDTEDDSDTEEWCERVEDSQDEYCKPLPSFPALEAKISKAIKQLGGAVFPKLNWSAPRDVTWISNDASLKCTTPGDVFLLLKSSEFITHDLTRRIKNVYRNDRGEGDAGNAVEAPPDFSFDLVLRKWTQVATAMEFRCFVIKGRLYGISQRDHTNYYPAILAIKSEIQSEIVTFFTEVLSNIFRETNYVFDVFRRGVKDIVLIDLNPLSEVTDTLLFDWEELRPQADEVPAAPELAAMPAECQTNDVAGLAAPQREITLTDHLNKSLLNSFLNRINEPSSDIPTYDEEDEEAFDNTDESDPETDSESIVSSEKTAYDAERSVDFRVVESESGIRPSVYINSRVPRDILEVQSASDIEALAKMFRENKLPNQDSDTEDEDS